jgi:hypothetical protein
MSEVLANPGVRPVGVPISVGQSVHYDPAPQHFAPVLTTVGVTAGIAGGGTAGARLLSRISGLGPVAGGALGAALGAGAGLLFGHLMANRHTNWGYGPIQLDRAEVPVLPAPTSGASTARVAPEQGRFADDVAAVNLGRFQLDTHVEGFTLWPSWAETSSELYGTGRVNEDGTEDRYTSLSDAMGAAEAANGQQAVVDRGAGSFALVDLHSGDIMAREGNSGGGSIRHIDSLVAADDTTAVALEYGDAWLTPSEPIERRSAKGGYEVTNRFWVRAEVQ